MIRDVIIYRTAPYSGHTSLVTSLINNGIPAISTDDLPNILDVKRAQDMLSGNVAAAILRPKQKTELISPAAAWLLSVWRNPRYKGKTPCIVTKVLFSSIFNLDNYAKSLSVKDCLFFRSSTLSMEKAMESEVLPDRLKTLALAAVNTQATLAYTKRWDALYDIPVGSWAHSVLGLASVSSTSAQSKVHNIQREDSVDLIKMMESLSDTSSIRVSKSFSKKYRYPKTL